jgi:hypothetical protein
MVTMGKRLRESKRTGSPAQDRDRPHNDRIFHEIGLKD